MGFGALVAVEVAVRVVVVAALRHTGAGAITRAGLWCEVGA